MLGLPALLLWTLLLQLLPRQMRQHPRQEQHCWQGRLLVHLTQ